jgi:hypothetical protein
LKPDLIVAIGSIGRIASRWPQVREQIKIPYGRLDALHTTPQVLLGQLLDVKDRAEEAHYAGAASTASGLGSPE